MKRTRDDLDFMILDDGEELERRTQKRKKKKSRMKRWQKVLLTVLGIFLFLVVGLGAAAVGIHKSGEARIKKELKKEKKTAEGKKEDLIYHNGKAYRYRENMINVLCLGIDKDVSMDQEKRENAMGQSDAIFIVSLDQNNKRMRLLAVPRETMTDIKIFNTEDQYLRTENRQITLQYTYGDGVKKSCELTKEAVSKLCYGLPIQRYCSLNFNAIPIMNDRIGGVPVVLDENIISSFPGEKAGDTVMLKGAKALDYIHMRDVDVFASSMDRLARQKEYMIAFANQAKGRLKEDITIAAGLFNDLQGNMYTDIELGEITYLATEVLGMEFSEEDLYMVPGETKMGEQYEEYYVNEPEFKDLIFQLFYDEVPEVKE